MGKFLIVTGILLLVIGLIMHFAPRLPFPGKLPGDIVIDKGNFKVYFPIMTSVLISIILSLILYFVNKVK